MSPSSPLQNMWLFTLVFIWWRHFVGKQARWQNAGIFPNKMTFWWRIVTSVSSQSTKLGWQKNWKIILIKIAVTLRFFIEFHSNFAEVCFVQLLSFWKLRNWFCVICPLIYHLTSKCIRKFSQFRHIVKKYETVTNLAGAYHVMLD